MDEIYKADAFFNPSKDLDPPDVVGGRPGMGVVPSPKDHRDFIFAQLRPPTAAPEEDYLEPEYLGPINNQGQLGTCTAEAGAGIVTYRKRRDYPSLDYVASVAQIYASEKQIDGMPNQPGSYPRCTMQVLQKTGACRDQTLPYSWLTSDVNVPPPPQAALDEAKNFVMGAYARVQTLDEVRTAINTRQGPVLLCVLVCQNFFSPEPGGFVDMPGGSVVGLHAVRCVGYNDKLTHSYKGTPPYTQPATRTGFLRCANSWGTSWGDDGYFWLPYDFFNGSSDTTHYVVEAWSNVDVILPPPQAKNITLWVNSTKAVVDGQEWQMPYPVVPEIGGSLTLAPLRFLAEHLGYTVMFNAGSQQITITR